MRKDYILPGLTLAGGAAGFALRRLELQTAFEPLTGLPVPAAATWALIAFSLLIAGALLLLCAGVHSLFPGGYDEAFRLPGTLSLTLVISSGFLLGAGGILKLVRLPDALREHAPYYGRIRLALSALPQLLLTVLCVGAAACVVLTAGRVYRGEAGGARSVMLLLPPYFGCAWLISAYQAKAADPVLLHYIYELLAISAVLLALYFISGFSFEKAKVKRTLYFSLLGVYLSCVTLADSRDLGTLLLFAFAILYLTTYAAALLANDRRLLEHPFSEGGGR